jgi:hypothetical protein
VTQPETPLCGLLDFFTLSIRAAVLERLSHAAQDVSIHLLFS